MSTTGLEVFDRTIHTTNVWLHEIVEELGPDRNHAWHVLGGVLRALRDQLPGALAAHFAAQLPLIIRGAFYEAWNPASETRKADSRDAFLAKIERNLQWTRPSNAEQAAHTVFAVLARHVDHEQLVTVRNALSEKVRRLWPEQLLDATAGGRPKARHASIERRAYEIWDRMGRPEGDQLAHWLEAEREVDSTAGDAAEPAAKKKAVAGPSSRRIRERKPRSGGTTAALAAK